MHKLDNPVWYALNEMHQEFAHFSGDQKFYNPEVCPFGASQDFNYPQTILESYANLNQDFYVVGNRPQDFFGLRLKNQLVCDQMIMEEPINSEFGKETKELIEGDYEKLYELVSLVQPGYFRYKTPYLGSYFGVFEEGKLIAAAGERMKMNNFTEISAIVCHPDFRGQGLAKQLIKIVSDKIFSEQKIPFLHVSESNYPAINLYKNLGFKHRRKMDFWNITKFEEI